MQTSRGTTTVIIQPHGNKGRQEFYAEGERCLLDIVAGMGVGDEMQVQVGHWSTDWLKVSSRGAGLYELEVVGRGGFFHIEAREVNHEDAVSVLLSYARGEGSWLYLPLWSEGSARESELRSEGGREEAERPLNMLVFGGAVASLAVGGLLGGVLAGGFDGGVLGGMGAISVVGVAILAHPLLRQITYDSLVLDEVRDDKSSCVRISA